MDHLREFDHEALLSATGNDDVLVREVCAIFTEHSADMMQSLQAAVRASDGDAIRRSAHALKGAAASIRADALRHLATEMEAMACGSGSGDVTGKMSEIEAAMHRLNSILYSLVRPDGTE